MEIIQRIETIWSRTKQLESMMTMMKYSCDVSKRKEAEAKCITPWFFMVGAFLIIKPSAFIEFQTAILKRPINAIRPVFVRVMGVVVIIIAISF